MAKKKVTVALLNESKKKVMKKLEEWFLSKQNDETVCVHKNIKRDTPSFERQKNPRHKIEENVMVSR